MNTTIESLEQRNMRTDLPQFKAGDTLRVHFKVIEGSRQRIQVFEGICIKRQGSGFRETFTVRKQSFGVGVERTFPLHSPKIEKLEVSDRRRAPRKALLLAQESGKEGARPRAPAELAVILGRVARSSGQRLLGLDRRLGVRFVAGADEAGRGSLAGPLVVAGVLLDYEALRGARVRPLALLNDSKQVARGAGSAVRGGGRVRDRDQRAGRPVGEIDRSASTARTSPGCARCSPISNRRRKRASSTASGSGPRRRRTERSSTETRAALRSRLRRSWPRSSATV